LWNIREIRYNSSLQKHAEEVRILRKSAHTLLTE